MTRKASLLPAALLCFAIPGFAANQIVNAQFTTDVTTGWTPGLWGATWVGTEGDTALGAARVNATSGGGSIGAVGIEQCTTATAAGIYDFGGAFKIEPTSSQTGSARLRVTWYTGPSCTGTPTIGDNIDPGSVAGWQALAVNNTTAPAGTASVLVELIQTVSGTGTFTAYWDDIYFGPDPTALPVRLQSFEVD